MWNSINKFFGGLAVGSLIGYVLGLISAPKSGSQLRQDIVDSSEDFYHHASDSFSDMKHKTEQTLHNLQEKGGEAVKKAGATVKERKQQIMKKFDELAGQSSSVLTDDGEFTGA